jgi:methyltransferase-like protein
MAFGLTGSTFVGIDLTRTAVAEGVETVTALGLDNITLHELDVMEVGPDFGQFDYIISHGLYSWVAAAEREKVLAISKTNLAPNGVAYVSYNTYPGSYPRQMLREMMCYHVRELREPRKQISEALALAKYLASWKHGSDEVRAFIKEECERLLNHEPGHLYHDELAEVNVPVFFHEFVEHAARHGLQYLGEADFYEMRPLPAAPEEPGLPQLPPADDLLKLEQYIDFVRCRRFRQTLLCHEDVSLERVLRPERMTGLYLASPAEPVSEPPDLGRAKAEEFRVTRHEKAGTLSTDHPLAKAAMVELGQDWPQSSAFEQLVERARDRLKKEGIEGGGDRADQDAPRLGEFMLRLYAANFVEVSVRSPKFTLEAGEYPVASPLARLQLRRQGRFTNLRHMIVEAQDDATRHLVLLLDGARDRAAIRRDLSGLVEKDISEQELEESLHKIARLALLVA